MNQRERTRRKRRLEGLVEERRSQLLARMRDAIRDGQLGAPSARDGVLDDGDASQSQHETDIFFSMLQLAAGTVADGEAALRRLDEGRYGLCERCGEPISDGRLQAMPFARRCTPCEAERDRERAVVGWDSRLPGERSSVR